MVGGVCLSVRLYVCLFLLCSLFCFFFVCSCRSALTGFGESDNQAEKQSSQTQVQQSGAEAKALDLEEVFLVFFFSGEGNRDLYFGQEFRLTATSPPALSSDSFPPRLPGNFTLSCRIPC